MQKKDDAAKQEIITILLVDDIPEARENIKKMIAFEPDMKVVGSAGTGREGVALAKELKPNIIIMDVNMPDMDGIQATALITQAVPTTAVIILSVQYDQDYLQRAMLVGARFYLSKPVSMEDLYQTIRSVYVQHKQLAEQYRTLTSAVVKAPIASTTETDNDPAGHIIVVYSPQGGAGCTTIATNLASSLMREGVRALLVDADLQFGDVGVFLNLQAHSTIVDLVRSIADLDAELFDNVVVTHDSGLKVLMGPARPAEAFIVQQDPSVVATIIQKIANQYDFIIVDTGRYLDETLGSIFDIADKILLLATPTLTGIKNSRFVFDEFDKLGYPREKTWFILNKCSYQVDKDSLIRTDKINKFLKTNVQAEIPYNRSEVLKSIAKGKPLVTEKIASNISIAGHISVFADTLVKSFQKKNIFPLIQKENLSIPNELEIEALRQKHYIASEKLLLAQANLSLVHVIEKMYKVAFSAAHDMRSPLGIAIDTIGTTIHKNEDNIELLELANQLQACLQEVNSFLNISLFEEGGSDTQNAIELLRQMANTLKGIGLIQIKIDPKEMLFLQARRTQLQLLLYNLLMIGLNWPSSNNSPTISLSNKALIFTVIQKEAQGFNTARVGKLGTRSKFDATGTRFYVIDRILRHIGGKFVVETNEDEVRLIVYPPPDNWKRRSNSLAPDELKKEILQFQQSIDQALAKELTKGQQSQIDQIYIDIVSSFYREMSKHFYRANTKLTALTKFNQDVLMDKVSRNIQYCELLVRNILLTATGAETNHQNVKLYETISDTVALIERKAIPARIELIVDVFPTDITIQTDKLGLQQVLMNLGKNAIDAIKHDGCIMFHAHLHADRVFIDITDTGSGIPDELQNRIFQLGFSTKTGGYGLGLHSVKALVEEIKGNIGFQTLQGLGTVMHIELPIGEKNG